MDSISHTRVANLLLAHIQENAGVTFDANAFRYGNLKPDLTGTYLTKRHYPSLMFDEVMDKLRAFCSNYTLRDANGRDLSVDLGEICHYLTDFFCYLFGREFQDLDLPNGLPVNRASFEHLQEAGSGDDSAVSFAIMTEGGNGDAFSVDVRQASAEQFARLKEMAETVTAVGSGESAIEDAVLESGPKALNGSLSVEDTVAEIVQKAAIYLAE